MCADPCHAQTDIVAIVGLAELLDRRLIGTNGLDHGRFAVQRDALWMAPSIDAAGAYVAWHAAYFSLGAVERRWLASAVAEDLRRAG